MIRATWDNRCELSDDVLPMGSLTAQWTGVAADESQRCSSVDGSELTSIPSRPSLVIVSDVHCDSSAMHKTKKRKMVEKKTFLHD
jgi:hypothetical protein